jgi:hypothetical protein
LPPATERGFSEGTLAIRHLPIGHERRLRPGPAPTRVSLAAATAFLAAGCCAGAVVGLLQTDPWAVVPPRADVDVAAVVGDPVPAPPPPVRTTSADASTVAPTVLPPLDVTVPVAVIEQALPPPAEADAAEARDDVPETLRSSVTLAATIGAATIGAAAQDETPAQAHASVAPLAVPTPGTAASDSSAVDDGAAHTADARVASPSDEPSATLPAAPPQAKPEQTAKAQKTRSGRFEVSLPRGGRVKKAFALASPARVVVDVKGAALPGHLPEVAGARAVRVGRHEQGIERVVIVLEGDAKPELARAKIAGDRLVVRWRR